MERTELDNLRGLIARARQRDEPALTELLEAHADRLLESIRGELGDRLRQRDQPGLPEPDGAEAG